MYVCMYVCMYVSLSLLYIYIYIYVDSLATVNGQATPSPPTKSLDFGGFESSRLLILRGGNSHVC